MRTKAGPGMQAYAADFQAFAREVLEIDVTPFQTEMARLSTPGGRLALKADLKRRLEELS